MNLHSVYVPRRSPGPNSACICYVTRVPKTPYKRQARANQGVSECIERTIRAGVDSALSEGVARSYPVHMDRCRIFMFTAVLALAGCASLGLNEHANMLHTAVQDDQTCIQRGSKYPDPEYITCRMQLQDDRLHQAWLNLQLMHQTANQPNIIPAPYTGNEVYRPLRREYFDCQLITEDKHDYVLCAEDEKAEKP